MDIELKSLRELRKALDEKKISALELAKFYLEKIEFKDKELGSFLTVTKERAFSDAKKAQELIDKGDAKSLTGIPLAIKDNICTRDIRTTCSSKMLENFLPPYNASVIDYLEEEGYVLLGKTNLDEFAMGADTQTSSILKTKNPYDLERIPGGSSGGSAAAVSAGFAPAALGSDTGGSIRQPSGFCGVTGLKPTYGAVSRFGAVPFASSLDQIGPIANSAYDCGIIMNCIANYDDKDACCVKNINRDYLKDIGKSIQGMKIAIPNEFFGDNINSEVKQAVLDACKQYEKLGAVLVECSMPALEYVIPAYYLISSAEAASNLARFDGIKYGLRGKGATYEEMLRDSRTKGFGSEVKRRILLGNYALSSGFYDDYYIKALALKQQIIAQYNKIFEEADVIITPTSPNTARRIDEKCTPVEIYQGDVCTASVSIASLPAINTICGYDSKNMPIGMSIVGKKFDESTLIQVADLFENNFERISPQF